MFGNSSGLYNFSSSLISSIEEALCEAKADRTCAFLEDTLEIFKVYCSLFRSYYGIPFHFGVTVELLTAAQGGC